MTPNLYPGRCTKCGGTMALASDHWGVYVSCWPCGKTFDLDADGNPMVPITGRDDGRVPRELKVEPKIADLNDVGPWIKKERIAKGWSRARLATALGLKENTIRRWECEEIPVSTHRIEELTELFALGDERPWRKRGEQARRVAI